jgi:hypothetical protein
VEERRLLGHFPEGGGEEAFPEGLCPEEVKTDPLPKNRAVAQKNPKFSSGMNPVRRAGRWIEA